MKHFIFPKLQTCVFLPPNLIGFNVFEMIPISRNDIQKLQVSSVMKNDKSFGKQNIFDGNDDTCWSSDEGSPQWILIELKKLCNICSFSIQFQGGFVGKNCIAEFTNDEKSISVPFYPEDVNSIQKFKLVKTVNCKLVKFVFEGSTDFFGRIVVYSIDFQ